MRIFSVDGFLYRLISKLTDLLLLTILWLICCIPIITIGASTVAVYSVTLKMVKGEESYIVKSFFKAFAANFKQSTLAWIIYLFFGGILAYTFYLYFYGMKGMLPTFFIGILFLAAFLYIISLLYVFPLIARYENTVKQTIKNTILIAFRYSFRTLQMLFVIIILIAIGMWNLYTIFFAIIIGGGTIMFILSFFFRVVFDNLEANIEENKKNLEEQKNGNVMAGEEYLVENEEE